VEEAGTKRHPGHVAVVAGLVALISAGAAFATLSHRSPRGWLPGAAAAISVGLALTMSAPVLGLLRRLAIFDVPTQRSSHTRPTPRGGGLAILLAVLGCAAAGALGRPPAVVWVCGAIGCLGLADDLLAVTPFRRLVLQIFGSLVAVGLLFRGWEAPPFLRVSVALLGAFWIAGFVNAFNFMDGINGIASTQAAITCACWWFLAARHGDNVLATAAAIVGGACVGFLPYNFPQAKVFLGDVGSYFVGSALAVMALACLRAGLPVGLVLAPLLVFICDPAVTLAKRWRQGASLMESHRAHTYQILSNSGLGHAATTGIVAATSASLLGLGYVTRSAGVAGHIGYVAGSLAILAAYLALPRLIGPGAAAPFAEVVTTTPRSLSLVRAITVGRRWLSSSGPKLLLTDSAAWLVSYGVILVMLSVLGVQAPRVDAARFILSASLGQTLFGLIVGTYRKRWRIATFGEFCGLSALLGCNLAFMCVSRVVWSSNSSGNALAVLVGLGSLPVMLVPRGIWRLLGYRRHVRMPGATKVLVYGAGHTAALIVPLLLDPWSALDPVGLLDDDLGKRILSIRGVRVLGTGSELAEISQRLGVGLVVVATRGPDGATPPHVLEQIQAAGLQAVVPLSLGSQLLRPSALVA
jgi:UDP-GlcNAc:undecaprenyl-phosphate/decaprenyl-phosphate GlcNAc-1-phosphate transferase